MDKKITDIQNLFWSAYRKFSRTGNMAEYNADLQRIVEKYASDNPMREFCVDLAIAWAKIVNELRRWML